MLAVTLKKPYGNSVSNYLSSPDIGDNQWCARGHGEDNVVICDKEIQLTNELVQYLHYFAFTSNKNIKHSLKSFSNFPIKEV